MLYVCNDCGTVDDNGITGPDGAGGAPRPPLCAACWPQGKWHGEFPRRHWREFLQEHPDAVLANLRPCFCGADPLSHDMADPMMPHRGTRCPGYSPVPWRPGHMAALGGSHG